VPDLWCDVDTALAEVPVNIMPLLDDTDFKTREVAIAYNAAGMDLVWNFVTTGGAFTQTAVTPTTAGNYDWTHQGDGMYTIEIPASGGVSINNDTEGFGWFTGLVTGVLPWRGPTIGFRAAALNNAMIDGGDTLDVNLTEWLGTAAATPTVAGVPEVDVTHWLGTAAATPTVAGVPEVDLTHLGGVAQSATDLKDFADDGYDPATNKVQGVVLVDTLTTYTGNTVQTGDSFARLGAPAGASVSADIATIDNFVDTEITDIQARLPAALVGGKMDSDATAISGDTTAADNLEKEYDGTGYGQVLQRTTIATLASQTSFTLTAGSADNDAYNGCIMVIEDVSTAAQKAVAVILDYVGATKTITLLNDPAIFTIATTDIVTIIADRAVKPTVDNRTLGVAADGDLLEVNTLTGHTAQTGDNFVRLGAPAGASVSADILVVDNLVDDLESRLGTPSNLGSGATVAANLVDIEGQTDDIGAAGAGLTAIPWNAAWDAEVQSEVDDALVARFLDKLILASGTADSGNTLTMVDAARTEGDADYWKGRLIVFTSGVIAGQCAIITDFNATTDTFTFAPALTQAVATQTYVILPGISVWDDTLAEHLAAGSTGNALNAAGSAGDPWATAIPGAYGAGTAGKIVGDNVNATISSRASQTSLDTLDDFVDTEVAAIITTLGTPAGASVSADIAAIEAQTDDIGAAGAGLTAVPWNAAWDAEVQSEVDDALVAHNLDHLVGTATAIPAIPAGTYIDQMMDDGTAVYDRTTDSLQAIRDKSTDIETKIDTIDNFVDTEVAAIKTVTDALPNAGALTTIQADLDDIQTRLPAALVTGRIDASVGAMAAGVVTAAAIATGAVDADAIAADAVTEIQSGLATAAALDTVDNLLDTEIADIQARLPAALTAGGNIKADALAVNGNTSAAAQLAKSAATIVSGAAIAGTLSTTQMTTDLTEATDDHYNGRIIIWTSGVLINQATDITDYTGATKLFTYTAVTEAPSAGDTFIVV